HVDCYLGPFQDSETVYVVHQARFGNWDEWDEDKAMIGFESLDDAVRAFHMHYNDPRFLLDVTPVHYPDFVEKVLNTKNEPAMIKSCCDHHETLAKAFGDTHDIWAPHENPFIEHIIELFTQRGLLRHEVVKGELNAWLLGNNYKPAKAVQKPGMMPVWSKDERSLVKMYLSNIPVEQFTLEDYDYLVSYLIQRYLPADELMSEAEWLVSRSYLLGKAQAHIGTITRPAADALMAALPLTVNDVAMTFNLTAAERKILDYGKAFAVDAVVQASDSFRHELKRTILTHMSEQAGGEKLTNTGVLQQKLFDTYASANRDWRRIATTEAGEMSGQGFLSSMPV
ncbi:MAG: hypothetical protein IBX56_19535, partial [Methylomicrobium sp.]|nr:hypothetical protein [Methylomicrobium sp.]